MIEKLKFFKVTKRVEPEWGQTEQVWSKIFVARERSTVEAVVRDRFGPLKKYFSMDRCAEIITIEECDGEIL